MLNMDMFEIVTSRDTAKDAQEFFCDRCGKVVCDIETNMSLTALVDAATAHEASERAEFLTHILMSGVSFGSYWCEYVDGTDTTAVVTLHDDDDTDTRHTIDHATIERGLALLIKDGADYSNMGYRRSSYGDTAARMRRFSESNGWDSDADAMDHDAIVQLGLLGEVRYG